MLLGMWDPPRPETKLVSPALAGGFFTIESPVPILFKVTILVKNLLCFRSLQRNLKKLSICFHNNPIKYVLIISLMFEKTKGREVKPVLLWLFSC